MEIALRPQLLIIEMNWNNSISRKIMGNNMNGTKKKQMKFKKINNLYSRQKIIARFQFIFYYYGIYSSSLLRQFSIKVIFLKKKKKEIRFL